MDTLVTLYSIGGAHFVYDVLNGVKMLVSDPNFLVAVKTGLLLGVLYMTLQGLMMGRFPAWQQLLLCLIVYAALFGLPGKGKPYQGMDLDIYNVYSNENLKVDDVPWGIGLMAGALSALTWNLTERFEQAFNPVDATRVTHNGYLSSLNLVMTLRNEAMNVFRRGHYELGESWYNYIKECTLVGIDADFKTLDTVFNSKDILKALKQTSAFYGTRIYSPIKDEKTGKVERQWTLPTCTEAFEFLKGETETLFTQLDQPNANVRSPLSLGTAMAALGLQADSARNFLMASALLPIYHDAAIDRLQMLEQPTAALMMQQSLLQRTTQWAAEQTMFEKMMRPLMTWIEGFVFAVTPLMGLLVCVGLFGVRLAFRYLMLLLWIQLWMPVLAVSNLYITSVAKGALSALQSPTGSFNSVLEMGPILEHWLGIGGLMASSTPAIVLMLLYGSAITATHLAGRMQSGDFVNEKVTAPDIMMPSAALKQEPGWQTGGAQKSTVTAMGLSQRAPVLNLGQSLSNTVQSADTARHGHNLAFEQATSHAFKKTYDESLEANELKSFSTSLASGSSHLSQTINNKAREIKSQLGISASQAREMVVARTANYGMSAGHAGGNIGYQKSHAGQNTEKQSAETDDLMALAEHEGLFDNWDATVNKSMKMDASEGMKEGWMKALGLSDDQSYKKKGEQALASESRYQTASQLQNDLGNRQAIQPEVWAPQIAASPEAMFLLNNPADLDFNRRAEQNFQQIRSEFASDRHASAAALVKTHLDKGDETSLNTLGQAMQAAGLISGDRTLPKGSSQHQGLKNQTLDLGAGQIRQTVENQLQTPEALSRENIEQKLQEKDGLPDLTTLQQQSLTPEALKASTGMIGRLFNDHRQQQSRINKHYQGSPEFRQRVTNHMVRDPAGNSLMKLGVESGTQVTAQEAGAMAEAHGLTMAQQAMFYSLVEDHRKNLGRSKAPADRMHRHGQGIAEISRGWGDPHGAQLGWHAFHHLANAADNPHYTEAGLKLIGEMNRLYQPELRQYQQDIDRQFQGETLCPTGDNRLDSSQALSLRDRTEAFPRGKTLELREQENNLLVFGDRNKGPYLGDEPGSLNHFKSTVRDMKEWVGNQVKPGDW